MNYMNTSDQNLDYYVKIFDSPRSRVLPEALSAEVVDLANIHRTLFAIYKKRNLITLWNKLKTVRSSRVWIEYSGNPFANIIICVILYMNRNSITLDCHNSAIENTAGKHLRHIISLNYVKMVRFVLDVNVVVHNSAIEKQFKGARVFYTPFPKLPEVMVREHKNDVIFLCSLNDDEPMSLILRLCNALSKIGYKVRITGNPRKAPSIEFNNYMFDTYLSYEDYLSELYNSNLSISLTERSETLLFAPREAVVLGVKCLVNQSPINADFYQNKVFYTSLNYEDILLVITKLLKN